jgi:21S rRNA (GM2251-2'-O)-methyltransferase
MPAAGVGRPVWLALDEVTDPQNLGSLLRSALFLGAAGVLVSEKNSAPLSPAVSRASAGAMELMTVHSTRNLVRTLADAAEAGWLVAGAALEDSVTVGEMDHTSPTILVLGSEGKGLRTSVLRECGMLVRVPRGDSAACAVSADHAGLVDSLNVGVAGGVLLSAVIQAGESIKRG